jgi:hypothetical protein
MGRWSGRDRSCSVSTGIQNGTRTGNRTRLSASLIVNMLIFEIIVPDLLYFLFLCMKNFILYVL